MKSCFTSAVETALNQSGSTRSDRVDCQALGAELLHPCACQCVDGTEGSGIDGCDGEGMDLYQPSNVDDATAFLGKMRDGRLRCESLASEIFSPNPLDNVLFLRYT